MGKHAGQKQESLLHCRMVERVLGNSGALETVYKTLKCYHVSSVAARGNEDKWIACVRCTSIKKKKISG